MSNAVSVSATGPNPVDRHRRRRRWPVLLSLLGLLLVTPVPWLLPRESGWGMAWRLDGRLMVDGRPVDPPGRWTWLTAGRPPLLVEVLVQGGGATRDLRHAPLVLRPDVNEPMAVAVGLIHAGEDLELDLIVEALQPETLDYPPRAVVVELNGIELHSQEDWSEAVASQRTPITFRTEDGEVYQAPGPRLPYQRVYVVDRAPPEVMAAVGGGLSMAPPLRWFRNLALGRSHGLIVALTTYADAVGHDLADGRHIAATGGVRGDGTVTQVGGLAAKAEAARRAGVDVLFYPAVQKSQLRGFTPGSMRLVPVYHLAEAIDYLESPAGPGITPRPGSSP